MPIFLFGSSWGCTGAGGETLSVHVQVQCVDSLGRTDMSFSGYLRVTWPGWEGRASHTFLWVIFKSLSAFSSGWQKHQLISPRHPATTEEAPCCLSPKLGKVQDQSRGESVLGEQERPVAREKPCSCPRCLTRPRRGDKLGGTIGKCFLPLPLGAQ